MVPTGAQLVHYMYLQKHGSRGTVVGINTVSDTRKEQLMVPTGAQLVHYMYL